MRYHIGDNRLFADSTTHVGEALVRVQKTSDGFGTLTTIVYVMKFSRFYIYVRTENGLTLKYRISDGGRAGMSTDCDFLLCKHKDYVKLYFVEKQ